MSDRFQHDTFDARLPERQAARAPGVLPPWIASRLLRENEQLVSVRGPRYNPAWERYATHIAMFPCAIAAAVALVAAGRLALGTWDDELMLAPVLVGGGLVFGSVFVLALANGYFTRLVVTNARMLILQGYEVRRTWGLDDLPPWMVRRERRAGGETSRTVDMDALQTMLGGNPEGFAEAKSIWKLGKELDRFKRDTERG